MKSNSEIEKELQRLHQMEWKEFEQEIRNLLEHIFDFEDAEIVSTPYSHDGGRDVDVTLHVSRHSDIPWSFDLRIWGEAKHRNPKHRLRKEPLYGNIFEAQDKKIHNLVFFSNVNVGKKTQAQLRKAGFKCGLQVDFVVERVLAEEIVSRRLRASAKQSSAARTPALSAEHPLPLKAIAAFTTSYTSLVVDQKAADVTVEIRTPVFLIVDLQINARTGVSLDVSALETDAVMRLISTWSRFDLNGRTHYLSKWFVKPTVQGTFGSSKLRVQLQRNTGVPAQPVPVSLANRLIVERRLLVPDLTEKRRLFVDQLELRLRRWLRDPSSCFVAIVGSAGSGKSHVLAAVLERTLADELTTINLDASAIRKPDQLIDAVLSAATPFTVMLEDNAGEGALRHWMSERGMHPMDCDAVIDMLQLAGSTARLVDHLSHGPFKMGRALGLLLDLLASRDRILLVINDVHNMRADSIDLIMGLCAELRNAGNARIAVLATTRSRPMQQANGGAPGRSLEGRATRPIEQVLQANDFEIHEVPALSDGEAAALLRQSITGLPLKAANDIVAKVGRSPLNLKEALHFMEAASVISRDTQGEPFANNIGRLYKRDIFGRLGTATRARLNLITGTERLRLLQRAALFPNEAIAAFLADPSDGKARPGRANTIADLFRWAYRAELLRPGQSADRVAFDHDLIRDAVLATLDPFDLQYLAKDLSERVRGRIDVDLQWVAEWHFFAGDLATAATMAWRRGRFNLRARRAHDALSCFHLTALCLCDGDRRHAPLTALATRVNCTSAAIAMRAGDVRFLWRMLRRRRDRWDALVLRYMLSATQMITGGDHPDEAAATSEALTLVEAARGVCRPELSSLAPWFWQLRSEAASRAGRHLEAKQLLNAAIDALVGSVSRTDHALLGQCLVALAIAERHLGNPDASSAHLLRAYRLDLPVPWFLRFRIQANYGSLTFYTDIDRTIHHWQRALAMAYKDGNIMNIAHMLCDLAVAWILKDNYAQAESYLLEAEEILMREASYYQLIRMNLNLAAVELARNRFVNAREVLLDAWRDAERFAVARQSWRIQANLALVQESQSDDHAIVAATYHRVIHAVVPHLPEQVGESPKREWFPFLNLLMASREGSMIIATKDIDTQIGSTRRFQLEQRLDDGFDKAWARHLKLVAMRHRFILTE